MPKPRLIQDPELRLIVARLSADGDPSTEQVAAVTGMNYWTVRDRLAHHPGLESYPCPCGRGRLWAVVS